MKQKHDSSTAELPGITRPRGRPVSGVAMTMAERKRRSRERLGLSKITVDLSDDLASRLDEFAQFKEEPKRLIIERILRNHIMRKR